MTKDYIVKQVKENVDKQVIKIRSVVVSDAYYKELMAMSAVERRQEVVS